MLAWSEELITDVRKPRNHGYDVIVGGELLLITRITLANLSPSPKLKSSQAPDAPTFPVGGMPTTNSLA